jgi:transcriptional regulator with PAS, ATPase and Fis domain
MQAKLLRVLQENQIIRVGNNKHENIDVRIIATSNRNLPELIKDGNFREDLYYRLNIFPIEVPPLRDRLEDMPLLAGHFLQNFKDKYNYPNISISKNAMLKLEEYDWPGNIRQLQNSIERGVLLTGGTSDLKAEHILLTGNTHTSSDSALFNGNITIGNLEREAIFATLRRTKNNRTRAAKVLDITVRTLRNKLNLYKEQNILPKEFLIE